MRLLPVPRDGLYCDGEWQRQVEQSSGRGSGTLRAAGNDPPSVYGGRRPRRSVRTCSLPMWRVTTLEDRQEILAR